MTVTSITIRHWAVEAKSRASWQFRPIRQWAAVDMFALCTMHAPERESRDMQEALT